MSYFALVDTIELEGGTGSIETLAAGESTAFLLRLFDVTIQR